MSTALPPRHPGIDRLRGAVMVLMALDHARDFYCGFGNVTNLSSTTAALFWTRWVTHLCAPTFILLAGVGAWLHRRKHGAAATRRFLATRGLWLVLLELTLIKLVWVPEPFYRFMLLQVIWAIGIAMLALAACVMLPARAVLLAGLALVIGHDALLELRPEAPSWPWVIAFERGRLSLSEGHTVMVSYPVVAWIGVMLCGFGLGSLLDEARERSAFLLRLGAGLIVGFVLVRGLNGYGNPAPWEPQRSAAWTLLSFINCQKYPPSLSFLLVTLGVSSLLWSLLDRAPATPIMRWLATIGRVPLFYYLAHLYVLRVPGLVLGYLRFGADVAKPPPGPAGSPLLGLEYGYLAWLVALLVLTPICAWFAGVKARSDRWWLSYL